MVESFWLSGAPSSVLNHLDLCLQVRANVPTLLARGLASRIVREVEIVGCDAGSIQPRTPALHLHLPYPFAWRLRRHSCFGLRLDWRRASNQQRASCCCAAVELSVISGIRVCPGGPDNTRLYPLVSMTSLLCPDNDVHFRIVCQTDRRHPFAPLRFNLECCSVSALQPRVLLESLRLLHGRAVDL